MTDELRTRAHGVLALGFRRPSADGVEALAEGGTRRLLTDAADLLLVPQSIQWQQLGHFCEDVETHGAEAVASELLVEYGRLFLGPGTLPCPPYGSMYLDGVVMGPSALDAVRRYQDDGLKVHASWREPPDHIAVELGFMARLSAAYSRADDADEDADAARLLRIQAEFLRDHLGRWAPLFAERLGQATSCHLFRFLSGFLPVWLSFDGELLRAAMAELGVRTGCR